VTRDADFKPLLSKANEHGKETILFGAEPGLSVALKNSADYVIILKEGIMEHEYNSRDLKESGAEDFSEVPLPGEGQVKL